MSKSRVIVVGSLSWDDTARRLFGARKSQPWRNLEKSPGAGLRLRGVSRPGRDLARRAQAVASNRAVLIGLGKVAMPCLFRTLLVMLGLPSPRKRLALRPPPPPEDEVDTELDVACEADEAGEGGLLTDSDLKLSHYCRTRGSLDTVAGDIGVGVGVIADVETGVGGTHVVAEDSSAADVKAAWALVRCELERAS
ncbi:hypothetical protein B0H14DRAFT_2581624 [Mycena olivaceomarginata]|nr:hypothetical protein B0H14DRAFT_2581624 [Mycena olivaceomarginata]